MKPKFTFQLLIWLLLINSTASAQVWTALGGQAFSSGKVFATSTAIGLNDTPYIAYLDYAHNDAVSVEKYNGSSWVYVGNPGFSHTVTADGVEMVLILKISATGQPYVFFQDSVAPPFSVMTYSGGTWSLVDSASLTTVATNDQAVALSMDLDPSGNPYIAFIDGNQSGKATVLKHSSGSGWSDVGPALFTPGSTDFISLALDHTGTPWLAFADYTVNGKVSVEKFNGSNWILQGDEGFSGGTYGIEYPTSMAFDNNNNPYVAYNDGNVTSNADIKMFNGTNWVFVGDSDISVGTAYYISLAMAFGRIPVVAYADGNSNNEATVQYYGPSGWTSLGASDFSHSIATWTSLSIASNGTPYVGISDGSAGYAASVYTYGPGIPSGIDNITSISNLSVYPNPNNGRFQVRLQTTQQDNVQLSMYDMMGRTVWQGEPSSVNGSYSTSIDISDMAKGIYTLQLRTSTGVESRMVEVK